jgi:hypothetical protein
LFNCRNDAEQRAIWKAERRAISFALKNKVTVVAAEGNQADDLAHPTQDATSPDDTTPVLRDIHNDCAVVPVEVAGVIGVTANGKAPQVLLLELREWHGRRGRARRRFDPADHAGGAQRPGAVDVAGVAAHGDLPARAPGRRCVRGNLLLPAGHLDGVSPRRRRRRVDRERGCVEPGAVEARLQGSADPIGCPADESIYAFFPAIDNGAPQHCQGGKGSNSFNGKGQVNALSAVTASH